MQYKLTRDRNAFADDLEMRVNTKWSNFSNKQELSDHLAQRRTESLEQVGEYTRGSQGISLSHLAILRIATLSEMSWTNSTKYGWNLLRLK